MDFAAFNTSGLLTTVVARMTVRLACVALGRVFAFCMWNQYRKVKEFCDLEDVLIVFFKSQFYVEQL